jgi:hypothetical protein
MLTCAACSTSTERVLPAKDAKPAIAISDACEKLPGKVAPPVARKGDNAKVVLGRTRAALKTVNDRHDAKDGCMKKQREDFAKG